MIPCAKNIRDVEINIQRSSPVPNEIIRSVLRKIKGDFDFILLDCPPRMETLTFNALLASNSLLIPLQGEYSIQGLEDILNSMDDLETSNPDLKILSPVLNFYNKRNTVDLTLAEDIRNEYAQPKLQEKLVNKELICIPHATVFSQASYVKCSVFDLDAGKETPAKQAINQLVDLMVSEYKKL